MALEWLIPLPYLIAASAFAAVLFRQINQKLRWRVTPALEKRRTAYMFLVISLFIVNATLGISAALDDWFGLPFLQAYFHRSWQLSLLHLGAAIPGVILFWFYWVDHAPDNEEPDKKKLSDEG